MCEPVWNGPPSIGWVTLMQDCFSTYQRYFSIKNISKPLFHRIRPFIKIIEFGNVKFLKSISSKDGVWREVIEIDSNCTFSKKNEYFKNVKKNYFSVNKLVVRKQIHFSPISLKSWVYISDNIARAVGGTEY